MLRMNRHQKVAFERRVTMAPEPQFVDVVAWGAFRKECIEKKRLLWVELAFTWCRLMHAEMKTGKTLHDAIEATYLDVGAYFECGSDTCSDTWHSVLSVLEASWVHGHDLYAWHRLKFCK